MTGETVDLVWLGEAVPPPPWRLGSVIVSSSAPRTLREKLVEHLPSTSSRFCMFWDGALGAPEEARIRETVRKPGDLWHSGLLLGTSGHPRLMDFVVPTWMLNRDPDPRREATSWRLSLRACVTRTSVLRNIGLPCPDFQSLEGAAFELGHRYASRGILPRHIPSLVSNVTRVEVQMPFEDELRFVRMRFGSLWARWALWRAVTTGRVSAFEAFRHARLAGDASRSEDPSPYAPSLAEGSREQPSERHAVTVLIPTLDRYPYLRRLLTQLREQTVKPLEILVVDQTPRERRDHRLAADFSDLPLELIHRDEAGQCSARNAGLSRARGEGILFLDDDDEIPPDLIERHLETLARSRASVSSGVAHEVGAGPLPRGFTSFRVSDVFPTNNTLALRSVFRDSGLFDLAYDRGARADGDLGMRVYLGGALMVLNPAVSVLHHHAPTGGLRAHGARVITYASSRKRLLHRHLPSATEVYLAMRYFREDQVREMLRQRLFATFRIEGNLFVRCLRTALSILLLPDTLFRIRKARREAERLKRRFPVIPALDEARSSEAS